MPKKIFVLVNEGRAEVCTDTVPTGYEVEVIDMDLIRHGDTWPSVEAAIYFAMLELKQAS